VLSIPCNSFLHQCPQLLTLYLSNTPLVLVAAGQRGTNWTHGTSHKFMTPHLAFNIVGR
jgi:hypothetical protein